MPERSSYAEGVPSWVDLMTPDREASKSFYAALFGWEYEENPTDQGTTYTMATKNGKPVCGMGPIPPDMEGAPPMWNSYVTVDELEATLAKVDGAGGTVIMPAMDVMDAGRMAGIMEPGGAALFIWQAKEHIGAELVNEHGSLIWNELMSPDIPAAAKFYGEVFGWGHQSMPMDDGPDYNVFLVGEDMVCGGMAPPMEDIPPHWAVYFAVDDINESVAAATAAGATAMGPPMDTPAGWIAVLTDPVGAMVNLMQPAEASP